MKVISRKSLYRYITVILFVLLIIFLLYFSYNHTRERKEHFEIVQEKLDKFFDPKLDKDYGKYPVKHDNIFVSIGSYRDDECSDTLSSLYDNADAPHNIFVGICSQNHPDVKKEECLPTDFKYVNNIRLDRMKHTDALGPNYARYKCSHLWRGEQYFLQIDSHLKFKKGWDTIIKNMYKDLPPKSVLTHYPPAGMDSNPSYTCSSHYENNFHIISEASIIEPIKEPLITPYFSAGLFFSDAKVLYDVPFDPYVPYLFQGEEILMATRLYTHGWDMYNLTEPISTHNYDRDDKPKFWSDNAHKDWESVQEESNRRYYYIIGQDIDVKPQFLYKVDKYGMGNKRTLQQYFNFAGIDTKNKTVESRCGKKFNVSTQQWENLK